MYRPYFVQKFLKLQGVEITHVSIYNWITKYVGLMKTYLEKITPNVADAWRADELYLKIRGNPKYLYALMDDQTRFWIAQQVSDNKYTSNIRPIQKLSTEMNHLFLYAIEASRSSQIQNIRSYKEKWKHITR